MSIKAPHWLFICVAEAGLLHGVSPHVFLQSGALTETLHTLVTPVGLLTGVSPHVQLQSGAVTETLHTLVTPVGLFPGVSPHVDLRPEDPHENSLRGKALQV